MEQGKPLPPEVHEPELHRVYSFYRFGTQDRDVLEALALTRNLCQLARRSPGVRSHRLTVHRLMGFLTG